MWTGSGAPQPQDWPRQGDAPGHPSHTRFKLGAPCVPNASTGEKRELQPGPQHPRVLSPFSHTSLVISSDSSCECVSSMTDVGIRMKSSSEKLYIENTVKSNLNNIHDDNSLTLRAYSVSDTEHTARLISCILV